MMRSYGNGIRMQLGNFLCTPRTPEAGDWNLNIYGGCYWRHSAHGLLVFMVLMLSPCQGRVFLLSRDAGRGGGDVKLDQV